MPTATGLPQVGEVWERTIKLPPDWTPHVTRCVVLERGRGDYWSLRVYVPGQGTLLWVDPAYWLAHGDLAYVGPAGPETKKRLGLGGGDSHA
jgi:hypothetical protein